MQVSVESLSGLERRMTVEVPAERIDQEVDVRLRKMAGQTRIPGFRPGKAPLKVVRQRYGDEAFREVIGEMLYSTFREAVNLEKLRLAGDPSIEPVDMGPGKGLHYHATFEIFPEFDLADLAGIEIHRPVAEVTDEDVDRMIETLRTQYANWDVVDREARDGDRVKIDYEGRIDGELFQGGSAKDMAIQLGKGQFLPEFEQPLVGRKAGDELTIDFTFPEDYVSKDVAGKQAQFAVKVNSVEQMRLPELDDDFARIFGVTEGGMEKLRADIRTHMQRELDQAIKNRLKEQVMQTLNERHEFDLPSSLVKAEIDRMREEAMPPYGNPDPAALPDTHFEDAAKHRVALGLIIGEIVRRHQIRADRDRLRAALESITASYEDPQAVLSHYMSNPEAMGNIEAIVIEEQVVEWVIGQANVLDENLSFQDLASREGVR